MKINETLTEFKHKKEPTKPTVVSQAAVKAWTNTIQKLFDGRWNYKHVIIPVIEYTPNLDSDDGTLSRFKTLVVNYDNVEKTLTNYKLEDNLDVALSRNILLIEKGKKAVLITLDIIDTAPNLESISNDIKDAYIVLKTERGFHLYPKNPNTNRMGYDVKDPYWKQEYVRITESEAKGPITQHA